MPFWVLLVIVVIGLAVAAGLGVLAARYFIAASEGDDPAPKHR